MLKIGDKEYRNIQEQVEKNKQDIEYILQEEGVLNEFGIRVVGQEESIDDLPSVDDYKENNENWEYGDTYAIGEEAPYDLYVLTRANGTHPNDYWFEIGQFPMPGPNGQDGEDGTSIVYTSTNISHTIGWAVHTVPSVYPMVTKIGDLVVDSAGYLGVCTTLTENVIEIQTKAFIGGAPGQDGNNIRYYSGNLDTVINNYTQVNEDYNVGDVVVSSNGYLGTVASKSTSYVMVQTKASLVGPQGPTGASGAVLLVDETDVTVVNTATISFSENDISVQFGEITPQLNNMVYLFDDSTGNITGIYIISNSSVVSEETIYSASLIGKISSGKQSYQHNIRYTMSSGSAVYQGKVYITITNQQSTQMSFNDIRQWLLDKGFTINQYGNIQGIYGNVHGNVRDNNNATFYEVHGIMYNEFDAGMLFTRDNASTFAFGNSQNTADAYYSATWEDKVIPL